MVGELISPSLQSSNLIRNPRSRGAILNWPAAAGIGARSFRRGAAGALVFAGGTSAQPLRAGQWRGNAVRVYPDLGEDERRAVADIVIEDSDAEPSSLFLALLPPCPPGREALLRS